MTGRLRLVSGLAALMFALAGCGGREVEAATYASDVCHAYNTWRESVRKESAALSRSLNSDAPPHEKQESFRHSFDALMHETEMFNKDVDKAGVPDVEGGEAYAQSVTHFTEEAKTHFEEARKKVDALPTNDPAKFMEGSVELMNSTRDSLGKVVEEVQRPESGELRQAFRESEACRPSG